MKSKSNCQLRVRDRISGLPDALLWHILSFLETHYAVRTCILSTRWKNIWASVSTLDFVQARFQDREKFWDFVDYVLLFRYSSNIEKFRLRLRGDGVDQSRLNAWINTAIRRNVVELDLHAGNPFQSRLHELPKSLFTCKTLVILKLTSQFIISFPASGCFPSLKFLHVTFYHNVIVSMFKILANCPILEDLTMDGFLQYGESLHLTIAAPALKTLRICFFNTGCDTDADGYSYFINCPMLENLDLVDDASSTYCWVQAKSLVIASIYLLKHYSTEQPSFYHVTPLLAGASNVTDLCLSAHCFEVGSLPAYENLRQLKLVIQDCFCWELLTELLKRSPILESLVLEREVTDCLQEDSDIDEGSAHEEDSESVEGSEHEERYNYEEGSEHEGGSDHEEGSVNDHGSEHQHGPVNDQGSDHQWNPPDCVPKCCLLHLKIVSLERYTGDRNELEVAKYLLKYGQVLNKMTISIHDLDVNEKERIYKEILMVPRGSRTSIVEFS